MARVRIPGCVRAREGDPGSLRRSASPPSPRVPAADSGAQLAGIPAVGKLLVEMAHEAKTKARIPLDHPLETMVREGPSLPRLRPVPGRSHTACVLSFVSVPRQGLCMSGCEQVTQQEALRAYFAEHDPHLSKTFSIMNDSVGSIFTASPAGGMVVICGTGTMAQLITADERRFRCGGWGHLIGDEGSAYSITSAAIRETYRAMDGYTPDPTRPLPDVRRVFAALCEHFEVREHKVSTREKRRRTRLAGSWSCLVRRTRAPVRSRRALDADVRLLQEVEHCFVHGTPLGPCVKRGERALRPLPSSCSPSYSFSSSFSLPFSSSPSFLLLSLTRAVAHEGDVFAQSLFAEAGNHLGSMVRTLAVHLLPDEALAPVLDGRTARGEADAPVIEDVTVVAVGSVWKSFDLLRSSFLAAASAPGLVVDLNIGRVGDDAAKAGEGASGGGAGGGGGTVDRRGDGPANAGGPRITSLRLVRLTRSSAVGAAWKAAREHDIELPIDFSSTTEPLFEWRA